MNKNRIKKFIKNNFFVLSILILLILIFSQKTEYTRNTFNILSLSHSERFVKAQEKNIFSGFCKKQSHGYIAYIRNNFSHLFSKEIVPTIINFDKIRRKPYWIFLNTEYNLSENYFIILNANLSKDLDLSNYDILDNYQNICFLLKKND